MTQHCWQCGAPQISDLELDKRARHYRVRIRLYDQGDPDEPQADSDPELGPGEPGTVICAGLKGVAATVMQMAAAFHRTTALVGLDAETLEARIPGLRPTLSRRGGNAVWRLPYDTERATEGREPAWLARVDLERVADPALQPAEPNSKLRRTD